MEKYAPLVSIIIPTYNRAHYFQLALESALAQSYPHIEIIVVDDSTNMETYHLIQPYLYQYDSIHYYRNTKNIGGVLNFIKGYEYATGDYMNFLMDDDIFHPNKIQRMLNYFLQDTQHEITLVTSYRSFIDENGNEIADSIYNKRRFPHITTISGLQAGSSIISEFNWIGEPTTPLFRKKDFTEIFGVFSGRLYRCGVDIAAWLHLLSKGKLLYIPEPLSQLRLHTNNSSKNVEMKLYAVQDLLHLLFHCQKHHFLSEQNTYEQALQNIYEFFLIISQQLPLNQKQKQLCSYYSSLFEALFSSQKKNNLLQN